MEPTLPINVAANVLWSCPTLGHHLEHNGWILWISVCVIYGTGSGRHSWAWLTGHAVMGLTCLLGSYASSGAPAIAAGLGADHRASQQLEALMNAHSYSAIRGWELQWDELATELQVQGLAIVAKELPEGALRQEILDKVSSRYISMLELASTRDRLAQLPAPILIDF